jgi:hypothetical protein
LSLNSEQAQTPTRSVDHIQSHNRHELIFPSLAKMALNKNTVQQLQNSESRLKHYPVCCKAYHHLQVAQHLADLGDIPDEIMQNLNKLASAAASTGAMHHGIAGPRRRRPATGASLTSVSMHCSCSCTTDLSSRATAAGADVIWRNTERKMVKLAPNRPGRGARKHCRTECHRGTGRR